MDRFDNPEGSVVLLGNPSAKHPFSAIRSVESYWENLRAGRVVPARADVDPRGIENALEYAFVMERIATGIGRIRIAGSHLNEVMGMEVRGMPLSTFFTPDARRVLPDMLEEVFQAPAVAEMTLSGETSMGKPPIEGRLILLPLQSDLGDCSRILGCLVSHGVLGRTPRRFDIVANRSRKLSLASTPWPREDKDSTFERASWANQTTPTPPAPTSSVPSAIRPILTKPSNQPRPAPKPVLEKGHLKLFSFKD
jgi:hypothetical protein